MKNIHLIATDKPSRLHFDGELFLSPNYQDSKTINSIVEGRNIYITSDEEIKIGNWVLNIDENTIFKPSTYEIYHIKNSEAKYYEYCKKIILTTDQDLIKDGVQAIDDEFLKWFVKNPSCESVDVGLFPKFSNNLYGIIIPKEEPKTGSITECIKMIIDNQLNELEELKQETCEFMKEVGCIKDICTCNTGPKQETFIKPDYTDGEWLSPVPTERAWQEEKLVEIFGHYPTASPRWQYMNGLIQNSLDAKQMYSEEDMKLSFEAGKKGYMRGSYLTKEYYFTWKNFKQWFEQFKKK
jgi:hypothetical protein